MKVIKAVNIQTMSQRWTFFLALFFFVSGFAYPDFCRGETAVIPVRYRKASETLPVVNHFLSPAGIVTVDDRTNSLILIDTDEVIRNVKSYLERFDTPIKRVKIRLRFNEKQSSRDRRASVDGSISGKNWEISTGRENPDGLDIRLKDEKRSRRQSSEYIIHTTSGSSAYILTGKWCRMGEGGHLSVAVMRPVKIRSPISRWIPGWRLNRSLLATMQTLKLHPESLISIRTAKAELFILQQYPPVCRFRWVSG